MPAYTVCKNPSCATLVEGKVDACPKCGGPMRIVGESPLRGITLIICGIILVGMMGTITYNMYPSLTHAGETIDGTSFSGNADQARLILILFAAVIAFGLVALANGIFMLVTKRQSKAFVIVSLALAAALIIFAYVAVGSLKNAEEDKPAVRTYTPF
jgi:magnesium-transporting ATPase (P-type)